jgi:hypothetical protein
VVAGQFIVDVVVQPAPAFENSKLALEYDKAVFEAVDTI